MVCYSCRESRRKACKEQSEKVSTVLIKASHDGVRGNYGLDSERERGGVMLLLPSITRSVPPFYVSIGLTQRANRLVNRANIE